CSFQAEDGIRVLHVTGVQTCALPISPIPVTRPQPVAAPTAPARVQPDVQPVVEQVVVDEGTLQAEIVTTPPVDAGPADIAPPAEIGRASGREEADHLARDVASQERSA